MPPVPLTSKLPRRLTTRPRGLLRDATLVVALLVFDPNRFFLSIGGIFFVLGAALHFWSKGCLVRNWEVTAAGPYRMVRHPFYLANFLIDVGICLFSGAFWLPAVYALAFALVYLPTVRQEEIYLIERHGDSYRRYAASVRALLPVRLMAIFGPADFDWNNILREKEASRIMRVVAIPLYFVIAAALFHQTPLTDSQRLAVLWSSIGAAALLHVGSFLLRKHERRVRQAYIMEHSQ